MAATSLLVWGVGAVETTAANAATTSSGGTGAPHPAHHTPKLATQAQPTTLKGSGWSQTTFDSQHKAAANKAGVITSASMQHVSTTNPVTYTTNTFVDDPSGVAADCAAGSSTPCTLRDAVAAANAASQPAVVKLAPGEYQLVFGTVSLDNVNNYSVLVEPASGGASATVVSIPDTSPTSASMQHGFAPAGPAGAVSTPSVLLSDNAAAATSNYTVDFTTSVGGALPGNSTITVTAPTGTVLPASGYAVTDETNGSLSPSVAAVSLTNGGSTATLSLTPGSGYDQVPAAQALEMVITGVTNPAAVPSTQLSVATSADTTPVSSIHYSVLAPSGQVSGVSVSPSPSAAQATGSTYTVGFTSTSALSGAATPADTITLTAPAGTDFTSSTATDYSACAGASCTPSSSFFSSAAPASAGGSATNNEVVLTLASGSTVSAASPVTVTASQVTNPDVPSVTETLSVETSQDTVPTLSAAYAITAASPNQSIFSISSAPSGGLSEIDNLSLVSGGGSYGGAVYQGSNGPVELDYDNFYANSTSDGGGAAYLDAIAYLQGDTFSTDTSYDGAGVYADSSSDVLLNNVSFLYDAASGSGGGLFLYGTAAGSGITANYDTAGSDGGGLYLDSYTNQLSGVSAEHDSAYDGGGIYSYDYTSTLTDVVADHDTASDEGGGWYEDASTVTLNSTTGTVNDFSNDSAGYGAGIYIDDYSDVLSNVTADHDTANASYGEGGGINVDYTNDAQWTNVSAQGDSAYYGGGVYTYEVYGNLTWNGGTVGSATAPTSPASCTSSGPSADTAYDGGGIYLEYENFDGTISLNKLTVDGNSAHYGGAVYDDDAYYGGLAITNSDMSGNSACDSSWGEGGAIYGYEAIPSLTGTTIDDNYAEYEGGGIWYEGDYYGALDMSGGSLSHDAVSNDSGGGLYLYDGVATLTAVVLDHDSAAYGGGIYNYDSTLKVIGGSLSNDTADSASYGGWGGALYDEWGSEVTDITGTTFAGDTATGYPGSDGGGAIYEGSYDQLSLANDTFTGDTADWGGAAYLDDGGAAVHVTGSTFNGNTAVGTASNNGGGGAIYNDAWLTSLTNDTLTGNSTVNGSGGAVFNDYNIDLSLVTVADNSASTGAGGIDDESTATVGYSILSGDTAGGSPVECAGYGLPLGSGGHNVVSDTTCGVQSQGDNVGVNPDLGSLADNGGPTQTMAIPFWSPAVNVKASSACPTSADQRGDARPTTINGVQGCDAGAYQLQQPATQGYWMAASDGGVFNFGAAGFYGSEGGTHLNAPVVGIAPTPSGHGYWLVASDGGVFNFGDAGFYGSMGSKHLNSPVVGIAASPTGNGYWLVASDGGVFNFGDAGFYGSMGGKQLNAPIVGISADTATGGYWLVASDGGVFNFNAPLLGSEGGAKLNKPVVGMASPDGGGYWLVASDGGIFNFGDAGFYGSKGGTPLNKPVVGMAAPDSGGYWLAASDGGIFNFGDAGFYGSKGGSPLNQPVVAVAGL